LTVFLGSFLADYFFIAPRLLHRIADNPAALDLTLFFAVGLGVILLDRGHRAARARPGREVGGRKWAEAGRPDQGERLRATLDGIGDGVLVADADGHVATLNPVAECLLGQSSAEAEGRPLGDVFRLIDEQTRAEIDIPVARVLREGSVLTLAKDSLLVARDGSARPIDDSVSPIRNKDGQITGIVIVFRDTTERRGSERAVRESEERLRLAQEAARMGTWDYDIPTGRVTWSPVLEAMHGLEPGTFAGTFDAFLGCVHTEDREGVLRTIARTIEDGQDQFIEYRSVYPDGNQRWVEGRGKLFHDKRGRPTRLIGISVDVTERKRGEESLREADRRKDEFLATLAHELRNPLAPIRTGLQILKCGEVADPLVEMMDRQAEHLAVLIDDLMDASRISLGKIDLRKEEVALASVVDRAVAIARPAIDERGHQLSVSVPERDERLEADPNRLVQILSNLLENAAKYTDPGGQIRVHARREGGEVVIGVKDTGIGIAPESLTKVFDLFMQIERRLDRSQGGLGIGLCLVRSLVEMHGGTVTALSEGPGRGSEFVVRLPAIFGDRVEPHGSSRRSTPGDRPETACRRILVVDDNQDAANSLARYLMRVAGHEVEVAYDGPGALGLAQTFRPDVVLLDIGLPGMSGYEVAERLRERPETGEARLIALTGWGQEDDRRRSRSAGIDVHLVKPVDLDAILSLLAGPASGERPGTFGSSEATPG
jgi:PAS domain S-box-containing protein